MFDIFKTYSQSGNPFLREWNFYVCVRNMSCIQKNVQNVFGKKVINEHAAASSHLTVWGEGHLHHWMKAPRTGAAEQSLPQPPESFQEALWERHWVRSQVNLENSRPPQQGDLIGLSCGPGWISSRDVVRGQLLAVVDPEDPRSRSEYNTWW